VEVRATFATRSNDRYSLTVLRSGTGSGRVATGDRSIDCGETCAATYAAGTQVSLKAQPDPGSTFDGWSGACSGTAPDCLVTVDAARSVTATFSRTRFQLTVNRSGGGTVVSAPSGIDCGGQCTALYDQGTSVTLTATPLDASWTFGGFSGCDATSSATCTVSIGSARTVSATFVQVRYPLTVATSGGQGTVTSSDGAITCGSACSASYAAGSMLTLSAAPAAGNRFVGWSGACSGAGSCVVTMNSAKSVTATFAPTSYILTVAVAGTGQGSVLDSTGVIVCGARGNACSATFPAGTQVTLRPAPAGGALFAGFSGDCSGTGSCVVTMDGPRNVTGTFLRQYPLTVRVVGSPTCAPASGTVTSAPAGITCTLSGPDQICVAYFLPGTMVRLSATTPDSSFLGFTGACNTQSSICSVVMTDSLSVTATFCGRIL
jgi:hypothetical protein